MVHITARSEFPVHLSLTVFKCFLLTLRKFLQKQKKKSPIIAKTTFSNVLLLGEGSVQECLYDDNRKYKHMNFL